MQTPTLWARSGSHLRSGVSSQRGPAEGGHRAALCGSWLRVSALEVEAQAPLLRVSWREGPSQAASPHLLLDLLLPVNSPLPHWPLVHTYHRAPLTTSNVSLLTSQPLPLERDRICLSFLSLGPSISAQNLGLRHTPILKGPHDRRN